MHKGFIKTAALSGALSVILGAFGAHALKGWLTQDALGIFETAVRYLFYHVFALFAAGILYREFPSAAIKWAGRLFIAGMVLFCGSLFGLVYIKGENISGYNWIGAITPLGGLCFIAGWVCLWIAIRGKKNTQ